MKAVSIISLLFLHLVQSSDIEEHEQRKPFTYDESNFDERISTEPHFVMFFAPWCGHCKALQPAWDQLAEHYNTKQDIIKIAKVDCTIQRKLCSDNGVTGYPTLKLFMPDKEPVRHRGPRDIESLKNFVTLTLEGGGDQKASNSPVADSVEGLHDLTTDTFDDHVAHGHHFIKFYAPWCGHCKRLEPTWKQLATELKDRTDVKIGRVDCTANNKVCESYKVRGYPTLLWFENGDKLEQYQGGRSIENLLQMVSKMTGQKHELTKEEKKEVVDLPVADKKEAEQEQLLTEGLHQLSSDDFESIVSKGDAFVMFYAPWCGHCKRMEPAWKDLAKLYEDNDEIKIARVDCTKHSQVCKSHGVRGYPTLKFFRNGEEVQGTPGGATELTDETFDDAIGADGITFVKFYAPWCGHCKRLAPTWDKLADSYFSEVSANVVIAKMDCTKYGDICTDYEVRGYPTLKLYISGVHVGDYDGHSPRTLDALKAYVLKMYNSKGSLIEDQPRDEL